MGAAKNNKALASIRQLCCLGLPPDVVVPKLLQELHAWVPAESNHFTWSDPTGFPCNYYGELSGVERYIRLFFTEFALVPKPKLSPPYPELVRCSDVLTMGVDNGPVFLNSPFYFEVFRPMGGRFVLCAAINDNYRPYGLITLLRNPNTTPFSEADITSIRKLIPYFRHALGSQEGSNVALPQELDSQGMVLLTREGRITHMDGQARRLLYLATHPKTDGATLSHIDSDGMSMRISELCRNLVRIFQSKPAAVPSFEHQNNWGRFSFRGNWMDTTTGSREGSIGLVISHFIPRRLKLWQSIREINLSPRLQEVALHYADGRSLSELAKIMGISRNTAIYHVNTLYEKLQISPSKDALTDYLLGR